jgi:hypothetical protein
MQIGEVTPGHCLPVTKGWNYIVRLSRPSAEILNGAWTFPEAQRDRTYQAYSRPL